MQATLPDGWTQAEYEWLRALGQARDPAPLLQQNRDSLPARGEGWGGGAMFKSLRIGTYYPNYRVNRRCFW